jgi:hypothetical protein
MDVSFVRQEHYVAPDLAPSTWPTSKTNGLQILIHVSFDVTPYCLTHEMMTPLFFEMKGKYTNSATASCVRRRESSATSLREPQIPKEASTDSYL